MLFDKYQINYSTLVRTDLCLFFSIYLDGSRKSGVMLFTPLKQVRPSYRCIERWTAALMKPLMMARHSQPDTEGENSKGRQKDV